MEPTPPPADATRQPLVEFVRTNRQNAAYGFLALSVLFLALTGWAILKVSRAPTADAAKDKDKDKEKAEKPFDPFNPEGAETKVGDPNTGTFIVTAVGGGLLFLVTAAAGVWLLARPPEPGEAQQRTEARELLLAAGAASGMILIVLGIALFYLWADSLTAWLDKNDWKEAKWVLIPLLLVVGGAGLAFVSVQPSRAEERSNASVRRLVYGTNLGLSVLLLFVALVVANIAIGRKLPNKLDTTSSGFYTLANATTEYLARLDQPATAYAILSGQSRESEDTRRLLQAFADVPGTKFKVQIVSPTQNKSEINALKGKYPVLKQNDTGVLLTYGEDEKRHTFIREDEFAEQERTPRGQPPGGRNFVAESRIMRELQFLSENEQKAVVYFTQSAGELDITGTGDRLAGSSARRLKAFLERNYLDVRPLTFDLAAPKVPDDATVVVVAEPQRAYGEPVAAALRSYMTRALPDNRKGKLVVMSSARFDADRKVLKTGLEALLREFSVEMSDRAIYGEETRQVEPEQSVVVFAPPAIRARNPVAVTLGEKAVFLAPNWRPVGAAAATGPLRPLPLMMTLPGRFTWLESEEPRDVNQVMRDFQRPEVRAAKQLSEQPRVVAVVVSETLPDPQDVPGQPPPPGRDRRETGRLAVFGDGLLFSDQVAEQNPGGDPVTFDLLSATVDWLRDRPSLGIGAEAKKYKTYTFPVTADDTRTLWLPFLFSMLLVGGAGAGVWMIRRR